MLKFSSSHSDVYILVERTITVVGVGATNVAEQADRNNKQAIFMYFAPFSV